MADFFYYLCIYPLESVMQIVLDQAYAMTGSYGEALMLLSLCVTLALAPFYHLAERWQRLERGIQQRMRPKLEEIQAVFKGQERHMMLRTLYRQHSYSPIYAFRASAGLLIQVPFFFAAYQLVSTTAALNGAPFWFIQDLGKPDALLNIQGFSVNLLPFVMTAANLFSAHIYTTQLLAKERIQLYVLAGLFLVLLYSAPAALLVYWTCNNLLSIVKNILYHHFFPATAGETTKTAPAQPTAHDADTVFPRSPRWELAVFAACVVLFVTGVLLQKRLGAAPLVQTVMGCAFFCGITASGIRLRTIARSQSIYRGMWVFFALCLVLVGLSTAGLTSFKKISSLQGWIYFRLFAATIGTLAGYLLTQRPLISGLCAVHRYCRDRLPQAHATSLATAGAALSAVLLFCYTPAHLYASDPDFYYEPLAALMARCTLYALLFFAVFRGAMRFVTADSKPFYAAVISFFSLGFVLFVFAATADYGTMDGFLLQNPGILKTRWAPLVDALVYAASFGLLYAVFRFRKTILLTGGMQALACALFTVAVYTLWGLPLSPKAPAEETGAKLPEYNERLFGFTPEGTNVVVFMLDMFTGSHLQTLLDQDPALAGKLDGFTWYADTISPGATTLLSIAALTGGEAYTPEAINQSHPASLEEAMHKGFSVLPKTFVPQNYDVALVDIEGLLPDMLESMCPEAQKSLLVGKSYGTAYTGFWRERHGLPSPLPESHAPFLASVGLFKAAPWTLRNHIYYDGSWLNTQTVIHNPSEGPWAVIDSLPMISNIESKTSTIKFIASMLTHYPWRLDEATCMPLETTTKTVEKNGIIKEHLTTERCALRGISKWMEWLKVNNAYDNTIIILASDHDGNDSPVFGSAFDDLRQPRVPWKPDALLLVKPLNARGPLTISQQLMSSADILPIICEQTGGCNQVPSITEITRPGRIRTHSAGLASIRRHEKNRFVITSFQVNGTRDERSHWKEMP